MATAEKKFGEETFQTRHLPPTEAQRLLLRISKLAGPLITEVIAAIASLNPDQQARDSQAIIAFGKFLTDVDADEAEQLVHYLISQVKIKNVQHGYYEDIVFDVHFADNLIRAWQVAWWVLEVNYRSFYSAVGESGLFRATLSSAKVS